MKKILFALLTITLLLAFMACADVNEADVTTAPRTSIGRDQLVSMAPTATPPQRTPTPEREDMQLAVVTKVKAKDNTVTLAFYEIAGDEIKPTGETKEVNITDDTYLNFGDIFGYRGIGKFVNKKQNAEFFYENATQKYEKQPLYFFVMIDGEELRYADFYFEHYLG